MKTYKNSVIILKNSYVVIIAAGKLSVGGNVRSLARCGMISAVDIHCHCNTGDLHDTVTDECYRADTGFLKRERERLNVKACAVSPFSAVISADGVESGNSYFSEIAERDEFFYQWAVLDPRKESSFLQTEKLLKSKKVLGIKIHPDYHGYDVMDHADKIFSFANDVSAAILMHPQHIDKIARMAGDYPQMKLIIAHLGGAEWVDAVKGSRHKNVFTDTSGMASFKNNIIEYAVLKAGSEQILFGTDTYSCAFQRGRIDYADISESDKENILYKNALRLFGKKTDIFGFKF